MPEDTAPESSAPPSPPVATVGDLSQLYLGNILYAIERCALSLGEEGKANDAAFYRAIGRKLADAHGRTAKRDPR